MWLKFSYNITEEIVSTTFVSFEDIMWCNFCKYPQDLHDLPTYQLKLATNKGMKDGFFVIGKDNIKTVKDFLDKLPKDMFDDKI